MRIMNRRCSRICYFLLMLRSSLLASHAGILLKRAGVFLCGLSVATWKRLLDPYSPRGGGIEARMAKMADARDLKSCGGRLRVGSNLTPGILRGPPQ